MIEEIICIGLASGNIAMLGLIYFALKTFYLELY